MGDFRKGGEKRFGGYGGGFNRRDGGRGGFGGGRDRGPVTMHQAICDQCGKPCEVPFMPTSGKPVYCNVCFGGKKETGNNRSKDRLSQKNYDGYKVPTKPDFGSDISKGNNDEVKKQLEILNGKMGLLIKAVEAMASTKPLGKIKEVVKTVPVVKAKKIS
ncbi:MAG: CxxC-x17-CxxC domain-containing protein [Patescibacteria group bacterium]